MRVADTSFLYAFFNANDAHHRAAQDAMESSEPILIPHGIYQETLDLIRYRQGKATARACQDYLDGLPHAAIAPVAKARDMDEASHLFQAHERLSYADCLPLVVAGWGGHEVLSFDDEQLAVHRRPTP